MDGFQDFGLRFRVKIRYLCIMGISGKDISFEMRIFAAVNIDRAPGVQSAADENKRGIRGFCERIKGFIVAGNKNDIILLIFIQQDILQQVFLVFRPDDQSVSNPGIFQTGAKAGKSRA